jgi:hypothetical protein
LKSGDRITKCDHRLRWLTADFGDVSNHTPDAETANLTRLDKIVVMRLSILKAGHRLPQKVILRFITLAGLPVLDVIRTFMYRPEFFGRPFCDLGQLILRGESKWSVGQREYFGAHTSTLNHCHF